MSDAMILALLQAAAVLYAPIMRAATTGNAECVHAVQSGDARRDCVNEAILLGREIMKRMEKV